MQHHQQPRETIQELEPIHIEESSETIRRFQLQCRNVNVEVSNLGASIIRYETSTQDDTGKAHTEDIVLGYKDVATMYEQQNPVYFGAIVGRVANRIAKGQFYLNKQTYQLDINNPPNHLHGGKEGFSHRIWTVESTGTLSNHPHAGIPFVTFTLDSPDSDQGYPGHVKVTATYSLRPSLTTTGTTLRLEMSADLQNPDSTETPINLAQHSYFHLAPSQQSSDGGVLNHMISLECDEYTPLDDETSIPTRQVCPVSESPAMDFRKSRHLRQAIEDFGVQVRGYSFEQVQNDLTTRTPVSPYGIDHNYVVRHQPGLALPKVATISCGNRQLTVHASTPGVQVYTANYLNPTSETNAVCKQPYAAWSGICIETQHYPASIPSSSDDVLPSDFSKGKCPILTPVNPHYEHVVEYTLEEQLMDPMAGSGMATDGGTFPSIEAMWKSQDLSNWYHKSKDYYEENCATTVDGVLGGIGHISDIDLQGSREFLDNVLEKLPSQTRTIFKDGTAAECGAGIGRVSKGLLLDYCKQCHLVEASSRLLSAAPDYIGNGASRCRFYCSELQDWEPLENRYGAQRQGCILAYGFSPNSCVHSTSNSSCLVSVVCHLSHRRRHCCLIETL